MMATSTEQEIRTLEIVKEQEIAASIETVFETILEELGPYNQTFDGTSLSMKIEPWPGGRWYRDLGRTRAISGDTCRRSSRQRCWKSAGRFSCRIRCLECAIPVDGGARRDAGEVRAPRDGADSTRSYRGRKKCERRLDLHLGKDSPTCRGPQAVKRALPGPEG